MNRKRTDLLVAWFGLAAVATLLACGNTSVAPTTSPVGSPTSIATAGPIGLASIPNATIVPYTIRGTTSADLRAQMDRLGPTATGQHWDAVESWSISWTCPTSADGSCVLSSATVNYTNTVNSPAWTPPSGVDTSLVAAWSKYMIALRTHEKGHVDLTVAGVPSVLDALHKATCTSANAAANAALDRIRHRQTDYDAATNHGATQGARFPLGASGGA